VTTTRKERRRIDTPRNRSLLISQEVIYIAMSQGATFLFGSLHLLS
jgi:hypothetical protein